jgi:hypothetical protein
MKVDWKDPADAGRLRGLIADASNAKQRDRYRVTLIAGEGLAGKFDLQREEIAATVGRSRQFVDQWVGRYRQGGVGALVPKRQPGAAPKLTGEQQRQLCVMLDAGPDAEEGLAGIQRPDSAGKDRGTFRQSLFAERRLCLAASSWL